MTANAICTVHDVLWFQLDDKSQVAEARWQVSALARRIGFTPSEVGKAAIVMTELASNVLRHAQRGEVLLRRVENGHASGLEILALDRGPGIPNVEASLADGFSTAGSQGIGLGAVQRLSTSFDIYSQRGWGTVVVAQISPSEPPVGEVRVSGVAVPLNGETASGDAWVIRRGDRGFTLLVVDGLGHGPSAAQAAGEAVRAFATARPGMQAGPALEQISAALRPTRGAAAAVADADLRQGTLTYAGVGNIRSLIFTQGGSRSLVSMDGIAGHQVREVRQFTYPWTDDGILVMATDGLDTRWDLTGYPGISGRHPSLIAAALFRDHRRSRDDATVVVVKPSGRYGSGGAA